MGYATLRHSIALPVIKELRAQFNPRGVPEIRSAREDITPRHTTGVAMPPLPLLLSDIAATGVVLRTR